MSAEDISQRSLLEGERAAEETPKAQPGCKEDHQSTKTIEHTNLLSKINMTMLWLKKEFIALFKLAFPVVLTILFQYLLLFVSLIFIGHIPDEEYSSLKYASAGLGASFVNVTGLSVAQGFSTAVDTLCSQAYGFKNYKRVGVILQRGVLLVGLVLFPIWVIWLNAESLLLLVQQQPCVARLSAFYTQLQTIALPFILLYVILQHYLNAQSIVWQFVVIGLITNCINVILHTIMIYGAGLGYRGAVIALVLSNCLPPFMVIFYVRLRKLHKLTWGGFSWEMFNEWLPFLKLALPGMLMNCLEWWSAEVITFIAGGISNIELAATSVWFQIMVIIYMIPIGLSVATSVRVGNALGSGDPVQAKRISLVATGMAFCFALFWSIILLASKDHIGALFIANDDEVVKRVSDLMYVAAVMILTDFIQLVISGSLKGSGRQYIGAVMVFVAYYIIGLPLGSLLALKLGLGALGLWIGMACGNFVHTVVFIIILLTSKWKKLSEKAMKIAAQTTPSVEVVSSNDDTKDAEIEVSSVLKFDEFDESVTTSKTEENIELEGLGNDTDQDSLLSDKSDTQRTVSSKAPIVKRLKQVLLKGSLFVLGVAILIAGGVGSIFHPYVEPGEYLNCSDNYSLHNLSYY